jgi:ABC-type multidrug transport system fused ATPase/permease subunit
MKAIWYMVGQYWKYARGRRWMAIVVLVLNVVSFGLWTFEPMVFAQILNTLQTSSRDEMLPAITRWIFVWIGIYAGFNMLFRLSIYMENILAYRARQGFITGTYDLLSSLPVSWHADHHSGDTINRVDMAADSLRRFVQGQHEYASNVVSVLGPIIGLGFIGWDIAAMAFCITVVAFFTASLFDKAIVKYYKVVNGIQHRISAALYDFIGNIRTIIILRLGPKTRKDLADRLEDGYAPTVRVEGVLSQRKWLFINFVVLLQEVGIMYYYIYRQILSGGVVLIGNVAAIFQYMSFISHSLFSMADKYQEIMRMRANMEAVEPILGAVVEEIKPARIRKNWKNIEIRGLNFSYDAKEASLKDIDLKIRRGARIAFIGESGSGKSTLMGLLRGLHPADGCRVFVDGAESKGKLSALAGITTLMPQDPEIFENTVGYNITMGLEYPDALVEKMIRLSRFDKVLAKLPSGLSTDIREKGVNLSGGERQRLALARNLLAAVDSDIILMDEPTSSVDMANEKAIYDGVMKYFGGKTIISSIHKTYLLSGFDEVVKIEKGRIV